jgi:hypothetical protein
MKKSNVFWGAFLLVCGVLLLLFNLNIYKPDLTGYYKFWPILLILAGISMLKLNEVLKKVMVGFVGALLAFFLISGVFSFINFVSDLPDKIVFSDYDDTVTINYDSLSQETKSIFYEDQAAGRIKFEIGAGSIVMNSGTENLVDMYSDYGVLDFESDTEAGIADVRISGTTFVITDDSEEKKNKSFVIVNENIPWEISIDCGATQAEFNLSRLIIPEIEVNSGMSNLTFIFGDKQSKTDVDIKSGMTNFNFVIPSNVGCRIITKESFSQRIKPTEGQKDKWVFNGNKVYTKNYDDAEKKVEIEMEGAFSSVSVNVVSK